ncbi:MAG: pentapeptide repeat-containing protein [Rhodococcus sp. (in: high G+C Gram-positive bacteria)]
MKNLLADCSQCFGLCCVALPFARSSDFAADKAGGDPCNNLQNDYRCGIHSALRDKGFRGCTVYDCFGAGQKVSQDTYDGRSWLQNRETAREMFDVFPVMRQLHELLWYLTEAVDASATRRIHGALRQSLNETRALTDHTPAQLLELDIDAHRARTNTLLLEASDLVRAQAPGKKKNHRGADLVGKKLGGADLRGASFRGAYLIAADLRRADMRWADMIGADLRDADLRGADMRNSLYLTQFQINAARGDAATRIPESLTRPPHWG